MIASLFHYCHPEGLTSAFVSYFGLLICLDLEEQKAGNSKESNWKIKFKKPLNVFIIWHIFSSVHAKPPYGLSFLLLFSLALSPLCPPCLFYSLWGLVQLLFFLRGTKIMCFDTGWSPADPQKKKNPESSHQQNDNTVIRNYKFAPSSSPPGSEESELLRVQWVQIAFRLRYTALAL